MDLGSTQLEDGIGIWVTGYSRDPNTPNPQYPNTWYTGYCQEMSGKKVSAKAVVVTNLTTKVIDIITIFLVMINLHLFATGYPRSFVAGP